MISEISEKRLNELINIVGFHNKKAKYIKDTTQVIIEKYKGVVPDKLEALLDFPGVGPKMAHLLLQICFDKVEGISVDTHVHRISNRLKWVKKTTTPDQTAKALQEWLPIEHWEDINDMLVGFGQTICKPVRPRCYECKARSLCPYTPKTTEASASSKKRPTIDEDNEEQII